MSSFICSTNRNGKIFLKLASALITPVTMKDLGVSIQDFDYLAAVADLTRYCAPPLRLFMVLALWVIEIFSLFSNGKFFSNLSESDAEKYLQQWSESNSYWRYMILRPLHVIVYTCYYSQPMVAEKLGYQEVVDKKNLPKPRNLNGLINPENDSIEVEVCIIGSGAGGAVVAKELAEKGHDVLILEEGGFFSKDEFNSWPTLKRNGLIYRDGGLVATLGFPTILLPTGKAVGGTTVINSGTCFRTPERILEKWRTQYDLPDLSTESLNPYFDRVEKITKVKPVSEDLLGGNNKIVRRGIEKLGYHGAPLQRNVSECEGRGLCIFGCPVGAKQSMEQSYLPMAFNAGAKILPYCRVDKLIKQYGKIVRVEASILEPFTDKVKKRLTIYPQRVILAAGTLNSPRLLQKSGIGRESGQLGKNLTIHPTVKMVALFDEVIHGQKGVPQGYGLHDFAEQGMMYESVFFPPWLVATSIFQTQAKHYEIMKAYQHISIYGFLVHDEGRGRVTSAPDGRAVVWYNLGDRERRQFVQGLRILAEIYFAAGAKKLWPSLRNIHEIHSIHDIRLLDERKIHNRDIESSAFHPLGTCRMGSNSRCAVVDSNLKVFGMDNLWVCDGSVFPTSLGVNPQITIMAFANRCADHIHSL